MNKVRLNFYINEDDAQQFKDLCKKTGCSMSELFRRFIRTYIELWELNRYVPRELLKGNFGISVATSTDLLDAIKKMLKEKGEIDFTLKR